MIDGGGRQVCTCDLAEVLPVGVPEIGTVLWESQEVMECLPHVQQVAVCQGAPSHGCRGVQDCNGTVLSGNVSMADDNRAWCALRREGKGEEGRWVLGQVNGTYCWEYLFWERLWTN